MCITFSRVRDYKRGVSEALLVERQSVHVQWTESVNEGYEQGRVAQLGPRPRPWSNIPGVNNGPPRR